MLFNKSKELFATLAAYNEQIAAEEAIRQAMVKLLRVGNIEEDDIPQNDNLRATIQSLIGTKMNVFSALETVDLDYIEIGAYKCFKAEDEYTGIESIYFISPTTTLYLEDSYLGTY